ncbi:MAG: 4Fe-4S binding protein [Longibaculum sp.]
MIYNIYMSPTGSTQKVTSFVAEKFGEVTDIDLSLYQDDHHYEMNEKDLVVVGVPSFGGRVPAIAVKRLCRLKGHQTPAILIATFGNRAYEDTLLELKESLEQYGFITIAAIASVCEHSIMHQFAKGRPNQKDFNELLDFTKVIQERLTQPYQSIEVPGKHPYKEYHVIPLKPSASKLCNECGLCARRCPVQAIDIQHPRQTDKEKCISCMRCVKICPKQARQLNPLLLAGATQKLKKACQSEKKNEFF